MGVIVEGTLGEIAGAGERVEAVFVCTGYLLNLALHVRGLENALVPEVVIQLDE